MRWIAPVALLVVALLAPATLHSQSSGTGPVRGVLVNGTEGGGTPAGATVLLHQFGVDSGSVDTFETATDAAGAFSFDDVPPTPEGGSAAVVALYGGTRYSRVVSPAELSALAESGRLTLTVYESTQDVGVVTTASQSIIVTGIDASTRRIATAQIFTVENRSDTTLVPDLSAPPMIGQFSFLRFSLPADASGLDVSTELVGGEVIPVGTGFAITAPVQPGQHVVSFTYTAPYDGDTLAWRDNTLQGAESLRLLIPDEFGDIAVGGMAALEGITLGEVSYRVWGTQDVAPGAGVDLNLSGLPEPSWVTKLGNPLSEARFWFGAVPVLVAVALAGLLGWGIIRRRPTGNVG